MNFEMVLPRVCLGLWSISDGKHLAGDIKNMTSRLDRLLSDYSTDHANLRTGVGISRTHVNARWVRWPTITPALRRERQ